MHLRTWHIETAVVGSVLLVVALATHAGPVEWIGSAAVLLGYGHQSISSRLTEREAARPVPQVECYRMAAWHWAGKEVLWAAYFTLHHSYAALVGCAVFGLHPVWRRFYRAWRPLNRETVT